MEICYFGVEIGVVNEIIVGDYLDVFDVVFWVCVNCGVVFVVI